MAERKLVLNYVHVSLNFGLEFAKTAAKQFRELALADATDAPK